MEYHPALLASQDDGSGSKFASNMGCGSGMEISLGTLGGVNGSMFIPYTHINPPASSSSGGRRRRVRRPGRGPGGGHGRGRGVRRLHRLGGQRDGREHGEGGSGVVGGRTGRIAAALARPPPSANTSAPGTGPARGRKPPNYDESTDEEDDERRVFSGLTEEERRAEVAEYGHGYDGERLSDDQARRLLVLMEHASTCPGKTESAELGDENRSVLRPQERPRELTPRRFPFFSPPSLPPQAQVGEARQRLPLDQDAHAPRPGLHRPPPQRRRLSVPVVRRREAPDVPPSELRGRRPVHGLQPRGDGRGRGRGDGAGERTPDARRPERAQ
ncbi:hypothetical protein THAOC_19251, partial [Thalassiosira oceanica]